MKDGICISRRADRNFEYLGPVCSSFTFPRGMLTHWQILCSALNGVRLPSFPNHTVAVKYDECSCQRAFM